MAYSSATAQLQQALNNQGANLAVDGIMGPKTQAALDSYNAKVRASQSSSSSSSSGSSSSSSSSSGSSSSNNTSSSSSNNTGGSTSSKISTTTTLVNGTKSNTVSELQTKLIGLGYNVGYTGADGIYGPATEAAVKKYQADNNLTVDGKAGVNTITSLNSKSVSDSSAANKAAADAAANKVIVDKIIADPTQYENEVSKINADTSLTEDQKDAKIASLGDAVKTVDPSFEDYTKSGDTRTSYYNADERNASAEAQNLGYEQGFSKIAGDTNLVSKNFLNTISSDASIMAFYVNALTYGGYTMGDILNDMKRRELISKGGADAAKLKTLAVIDPEQNRNTYLATAEGQKAVSDTATLIPTFNFQGLLNPDILKYGTNMPDDLFKVLVPILDPESQEFKDAVEEVKSKYFDLTSAALQATTEQDKAVADYNLQQFKNQMQTNYGIALSDDASKAWTQIETLADTYAANGIANSGLQNEAVDKTLQATRKADQRLRDEKLTKEEQNKAAYYRSSATDEEINKLTPEQRKAWGLVPSSEVLQEFSIANLKEKNPTWTDEMVKQAHDAVIDKYGNYRSAIYAKYYGSVASTGQQNQTTAVNAVTQDALNKEAKAYKDYSTDTAFLGQTATGNNPDSTTPTSTKEDLTAAQKAAENINKNATNPISSVTGTPTPTNTIDPVSSTPSKKTYSTVYDYYMGTTGVNQSWNSTQRQKDAAAAKISNYTGTATQNDSLLKYLNSL